MSESQYVCPWCQSPLWVWEFPVSGGRATKCVRCFVDAERRLRLLLAGGIDRVMLRPEYEATQRLVGL
jgi:hypothetical protein